MDKLKSVLSHGSRKSDNGEGSHLEHARQGHHASTPAKGGDDFHPIYDQFSRTNQPGSTHVPTTATDSAHHAPNTASSTHNSSLRSDAFHGKPGPPTDENSAASIKSGVMGLAQGNQQTIPDRTAIVQKIGPADTNEYSVAGTEIPAHGLHRQKDYDDLRKPDYSSSTGPSSEKSVAQPFEQPIQEPIVATVTDRSFPLAGGVTSRRHDDQIHSLSTGEREPGTKDRDLGVSHSHGREALAGAAAAIGTAGTASSFAHPQQESRYNDQSLSEEQRGVPGTSTSSNTLRSEHDPRPGHHQADRSGHGGDALAGATSAYMASTTGDRAEGKPAHNVKFAGAQDPYDPCVTDNKPPQSTTFTSGPHRTDTANLIDPHLHVPGEFPETPMETPGERGQGTGSYVSGASRHDERSTAEHSATTGKDSTPFQTESDSKSQSHLNDYSGRNAAAIGAASLGAYGAGKHHQREATDVTGENMPPPANPYSSQKIDPRVDSRPAVFDQQRFDAAGQTQSFSQAVANAPYQTQPLGNSSQVDIERSEKDHHYARNADLAGAGAAAAGGIYYASQRGEKAEPGLPFSTVQSHDSEGANAANPQIHQDPTLQKQHNVSRSMEGPTTTATGFHGHATSGPHQSNKLNRVDRRADSQARPDGRHEHAGPNSAAGVGGADYGAQIAANEYADHRSTQPAASLDNQRYDPSVSSAHDPNQDSHHHYGKDAALAAGAGGLAYGASKKGDEVYPPTNQHAQQTSQSFQSPRSQEIASHDHDATHNPQHHYGRDAAVGAVGVGTAGAGYYVASNQGEDRGSASQQQVQQSNTHQRYDSVQESGQNQARQPEPHHRNVPARTNLAAGGVAVGAGAGAGYAYAQHDAQAAEKQAQEKELEHQRKVQQKELEKQQKHGQKAHEKELEHDRKAQQKELEKKEKEQQKAYVTRQKELEKEHAKEQKHYDKLVAAEEKAHRKEAEKKEIAHQKEVEKENARLQKEREKETHEKGKEKKHHLFGFLHHKDKKESPERSPRTSKEYVGDGRVSQEEHGSRRSSNSHEGRNKLHKDPSPGHPSWQVLEQQKQEQATDESVRHPVQVPRNDTLHSGVYEAPNHHGKAEGENMEGYRNLTGY